MTRLLDPAGRITAGRITFRDRDITKLTNTGLREMHGAAMAMIFQNPRGALNRSALSPSDRRRYPGASQRSAEEARRQALDCCAPCRSATRKSASTLIARTVRRHVPAGDDRDGDFLQPGAVDRR